MGLLSSLAGFGKDLAKGVIGAATGGAIGDIFGDSNAKDAYERNSALMERQAYINQYNYQKRYEWTMRDMKLSGLNPILAATGGFSVGPSPSVSLASAPMAPLPSGFPVASSAKEFSQSKESEASAIKLLEEAELARKRSNESLANAAKLRAQEGLFSAQERETMRRIDRIEVEINEIASRTHLLEQQEQESIQRTRLTKEERQRVIWMVRTLKAEYAELSATSKYYESPVGEKMKWLEKIMKVLQIPLGAALYGLTK